MFTRLKNFFTGLLQKTRLLPSRSDSVTGPQGGSRKLTELPLLSEDDLHLESLTREFSRELFAQLLMELPEYRTRMAQAHADGDYRYLRDSVHQILGAAAYCDAWEIESSLRELRLALKTEDPNTVDVYFTRAMDVIDSILHASGYR